MVDSFQILLFVVIIALTVIVSLIGIQVFLVLREVHDVVRKINRVADDAKKLSETALISLQNLTHSVGSVSGLLSLADFFHRKLLGAKSKGRKK